MFSSDASCQSCILPVVHDIYISVTRAQRNTSNVYAPLYYIVLQLYASVARYAKNINLMSLHNINTIV